MRQFCQRIVDARLFQTTVLVVIGLAALLVGLETFPEVASANERAFATLDAIFLGIFTLELAVRIGAYFPRPWLFFRDPWNVFDFLTVAIFYTPFVGSEAALLRLARVIRMFRLLRAIPGLQRVIIALMHSLPSLGYIGLLLTLLMYVYAVVGHFLFGDNDPDHFGNAAIAMRTLLQVVTFDEWALIMTSQTNQVASTLYFVSFILIGTMIVLNLFIGVVVEGFDHARREWEAEGEKLVVISDERRDGVEEDLSRISERLDEVKRELDQLVARARRT